MNKPAPDNVFATLVRKVEVEIESLREKVRQELPHPETVVRSRPGYPDELRTYYARMAVGHDSPFPDQYEEVPSDHYADEWLNYVHPDCSILKHQEQSPNSWRLTQEVLDLGQALISEVCQLHDVPSILFEEMIHKREKMSRDFRAPVTSMMVPQSPTLRRQAVILDRFIHWLRYWITSTAAVSRDEIPDVKIDPHVWWGPSMAVMCEEVCRRRPHPTLDYKLALSRDLNKYEADVEVGNPFGFTGLESLVLSYLPMSE